jgi:protein TonB
VKAPVVISIVEPTFTDVARRLEYGGSVRVMFIVKSDGSVANGRVISPLGLGLDEQALASVYQYRFKPAMRGDQPETVELAVDVSFQIR